MSPHDLLARAQSLLSVRSGLIGALALIPVAAVEAQTTVFTPTTSSFHTTTSGIPDYANSFGVSIDSLALNGGTGVKLWGDTGTHDKPSLAFTNYEGGPVHYRDGVTLKWNGVFSGDLIGNYYDAEDNYRDGDRIAVAYDFTIDRSAVNTGVQWEIHFEFDGSRNTIASGSVGGEETSFHVTGSAIGSNPVSWNEDPATYYNTAWSAYLVVMPYSSTIRYDWSDTDTVSVFVPGDSIDLSLSRAAYFTAVPEPSTWAVIVGAASLGVVLLRRRVRR